MISKLLSTSVQRKYSIFALTLGLTYFAFKTLKIHKYFRYTVDKLLVKNKLNLKSINNTTHVVSSTSESAFVIEQLLRKLNEGPKQVLGLDCEWVSTKGKRNPVALLQLAAPGGFSYLFRLCLLKSVPIELVKLLEDKNILKVGVAVIVDARYLLADYGVRCEGCLDLRFLASQVGVEPKGLAYLAKDLFGVDLNKDWRVRCSDWESHELSQEQIKYAAEDACIAVDIFNKLNHKEVCKRHNILERLFWSEKDYWQHSVKIWISHVGVNFKHKSKSGDSSGTPSSKRVKPIDTYIKRNYNTLLHKEHYSNIFLLAPDEEVLCTISNSKADWYIEKNLVDVVIEDPKTLKLKFEPSRRTTEPDGYFTKPKKNRCVVCGCKEDLRRKNVVPSEYRKHFEDVLKNHNSHDVLLLCIRCHSRSNLFDQHLRDQLVQECSAPLSSTHNSKMFELPDLRAVKSAARALYSRGDAIPQHRRAQLESVICNKLEISPDELTKDVLESTINMDSLVESEQYSPHGQKVVMHYLSSVQGGVETLERRWRQHFLDTMTPLYLPDLWSVNYVHD